MDSHVVIFFGVLHVVFLYWSYLFGIAPDSSALVHSVIPYLVGGSQLGASLPKNKKNLQLKFLQPCFLAILGMPRTLPPLKEVLTRLKRVERVFF